MRLNWVRSSEREDRLDTWMSQRRHEHVLAGKTTPVGPCPDEAFLRRLARQSAHISLSDPRTYHVASCLRCTNRVTMLRRESRVRRRALVLAVTGASCLLIIAAILIVARGGHYKHASANASSVFVADTINLWDAGTAQGTQAATLQSVSLPAAMIRVTVILPRFSAPGLYVVAVTRNQNSGSVMSADDSVVEANERQDRVSVDLDLRNAKTGKYFLSIARVGDQPLYYYPLWIK
jgi:hypothetical protein